MDESAPSAPQHEIFVGFIPQKLKGFLAEPDGCAMVASLEAQFQCSINVVNDALMITPGPDGVPVDSAQIDACIRDVWQKRDVQLMIREAALNASTTHVCQSILPRAYCAVVFFFSADFQRRSRCSDILIEHFAGKVTIFGSETAVCAARGMMIEILTEHFGTLEMEIPPVQRTSRMGYNHPAHLLNPDRSSPMMQSMSQPSFMNNMYPMGEPNAILSLTPRSSPPQQPIFDEALLSSELDRHLLFPPINSDFSMPPPHIAPQKFVEQPAQRTNNVEKIKHWIPTDEVGKILGNRAAAKKQIEAKFNCVVTVHTDVYPQFGMTGVDIMAQNKENCQGARDAVQNLMRSHQDVPSANSPSTDSGFNSPTASPEHVSTTPEKRRHFHRSSFRDQPKVVLALTPRKTAPSPAE